MCNVALVQRPIFKWNKQDQWNSAGQNVDDVDVESHQIYIDNKDIPSRAHFRVFYQFNQLINQFNSSLSGRIVVCNE